MHTFVLWEEAYENQCRHRNGTQKGPWSEGAFLLWSNSACHCTHANILKTAKKYDHVQHSMLGWWSFYMNYCSNSVWPGGVQSVALLGCSGSPGFFDRMGLASYIFFFARHMSGKFAGQSYKEIWNPCLHKAGQNISMKSYNLLLDGSADVWPAKTKCTNTSRWPGSSNHHRLWKLSTGA